MKSIIVYSAELRPQNLYPKRIISPPTSNKCCRSRMEVIGRPRTDELGRRFCYKRCTVCGFALRYFLEPVPSVLAPGTPEPKGRKAPTVKAPPPAAHAPRSAEAPARKPALSRHVQPKRGAPRAHASAPARRASARRRR
jgi:hypothetical protein